MSTYPSLEKLRSLCDHLGVYSHLAHEYGAADVEAQIEKTCNCLSAQIATIRRLPTDPRQAAAEPDGLDAIRALRPPGPRQCAVSIDHATYENKLSGALLARFAGCTLGAPVELWEISKMRELARETGDEFPPVDYWTRVPEPYRKRYEVTPREAYTRGKICGVPVDDDVTYTVLGLLILERYGPHPTTAEIAEAWLDWVPYACTAEEIALKNLRAGVDVARVGSHENPFVEWIGADIRADPWGYVAAGWPERAAALAYADGYLTHRRGGVYGEMFFAAAIAAAFVVDDPLEAIRLGLTEIPRKCALAHAVRWALQVAPELKDYADARRAVDERFAGMHPVHTINNACLTIFGLAIGGLDVTRVLGETVAMGLDNDCTAATAGSIVGAIVGADRIPSHWTTPFQDQAHTYLRDHDTFAISDLVRRFARQRERILG
jgi:ADP-ribosylglycohydrolase